MPKKLAFDNLVVGKSWTSPTHVITSDDVKCFANLTGDQNPLHTDQEFAAQTPFGQPIAHGLLGLSFVAGLGSESPLLDTVAFLAVYDWLFLHPIYFGDELHVVTEVTDLEPSGRKRGRVVLKRSLVNQHGDVVQEGYFESLVARSEVMAAPKVLSAR